MLHSPGPAPAGAIRNVPLWCGWGLAFTLSAFCGEGAKMPQERPPWLGSQAGLTDKVMWPWTPLRVRGRSVACWGRTYRFEATPFPTEVTAAGKQVLAGPVELRATVGGKPVAWRSESREWEKRGDAEAVWRAEARGGSLRLDGRATVEYDGMVRLDFVLAAEGPVSIEALSFAVPLKPEHASLFHFWPGKWGSGYNSGTVPAAGLDLPFKPFVWLGDEERGLGWFSESDQGWKPKDPNKAIHVRREGEAMVLTCELMSAPRQLAEPLRFTFGLHATPVRPIPRDFHEQRICHGAFYGMETKPYRAEAPNVSVLDRAKELGVKTLVFHEHWTDVQNYTSTTHDAELRSLVKACHERGIKLLLYFGYEMSNIAPEWPAYAPKCLTRLPDAPLPTTGGYQRKPEQHAFIVCYNSPWQDFLADGIARVVRDYGIDGVYLDGTIEPWGCVNHAHGCGYRRPDGSWAPAYAILAVRNLMKRLYAICDPEHGGLVNPHQSTCMVTPTLAWSTSYWDGEQFGSVAHQDNPLALLPLDCFRAEFMGHQWGVPAEFLTYPPHGYTVEEGLAFTLLHDVFIRPGGVGEQLERMAPVWNAYADFKYWEAEWMPYWRNSEVVTPSPEGVKVSLYARKGQGALLVVSNLGMKPVDASVRLDLRKLGLSRGKLVASDALLTQPIALDNGVLKTPLPRFSMRLIRIERER